LIRRGVIQPGARVGCNINPRGVTLWGIPNQLQMKSTWQTEGSFAMGRAISVRTDFTSGKLRQLAKRAKDAAQARRLLAIAAVLDGAPREAAAKTGGMARQTPRDWVIRFDEQGPDGLINTPSPGAPGSSMTSTRRFSPGSWRSALSRRALTGPRSDHAVV
jgi:hypothetical protein